MWKLVGGILVSCMATVTYSQSLQPTQVVIPGYTKESIPVPAIAIQPPSEKPVKTIIHAPVHKKNTLKIPISANPNCNQIMKEFLDIQQKNSPQSLLWYPFVNLSWIVQTLGSPYQEDLNKTIYRWYIFSISDFVLEVDQNGTTTYKGAIPSILQKKLKPGQKPTLHEAMQVLGTPNSISVDQSTLYAWRCQEGSYVEAIYNHVGKNEGTRQYIGKYCENPIDCQDFLLSVTTKPQ